MEWNPAIWVKDGRHYLTDVRAEFDKITWPGQQEYVGGTIGVLVITAILTVLLGLLDAGLSQIMEFILD